MQCRDTRATSCLYAGADYVRPSMYSMADRKIGADYVISLCSTEHLKTKKFVMKDLKGDGDLKPSKDIRTSTLKNKDFHSEAQRRRQRPEGEEISSPRRKQVLPL